MPLGVDVEAVGPNLDAISIVRVCGCMELASCDF